MSPSIRLVALISGGGTTLQNLIERIVAGSLPAEIAGVVSSRGDVPGVERARRAGLPVVVASKRGDGVWDAIRSFRPNLVCLAGWLNLLRIPEEFQNRVLNIHPSLLPAFGGKGMYGHHVHEAVLAYGSKVSGCTVHFADNGYDTGPIVVQKCVPVQEEDTPETLAARVFQAECEAYPKAIRLIGEGRVTIHGRRVMITT